MNNISQKICNLRTEHSLTQAQLAKIAGVSDKAISAWELGTRDPKIKSIQNICVYFGIDVNSFIDQSTKSYDETNPPAHVDEGIWKTICSDSAKLRLVTWVSGLDSETFRRMEKILDAAFDL